MIRRDYPSPTRLTLSLTCRRPDSASGFSVISAFRRAAASVAKPVSRHSNVASHASRSGARIPVTALFEMPRLMRDAQAVFSATGGLHAAGLFEFDAALSQGSNVRLLVLREDVGRHNAVDKIIGYALLHDKVPLNYAALGGAERSRAHQRNEVERANESARCATEEESATCAYAPGEAERSRAHQRNEVERANESARCAIEEESATCAYAMMVSGRLSFEIVQKAAAAGVAILCAVSAPSSLAVELAEEVGMTLVGFLREPNLNIYTAEERIVC